MSSSSRQYASRYISGLKATHKSTTSSSSQSTRVSQPQPLLFLYPSWFQQRWYRQYHTDHETGRDQNPDRKNDSRQNSRKRSKTSRDFGPPIRKYVSHPADPLKPSLVRKAESSKPGQEHYKRKIDAEKVFFLLSGASTKNELVTGDEHAFSISKQRAFALTGHTSADAWIHHEDTGCAVKVKPSADGTRSIVSLDGSERARMLAREYINSLRIEKRYSRHVKSRTEWVNTIRNFPATADICDLPRPPQWSNQTFFHFVTALTQIEAPYGMNRYIYHGGETRNSRIAGMLESLLTDPATRLFASSSSVEKALRFCRRRTELAASARRIWDSARSLGIPLSIKCYNEEMARCLISKNSHRFMSTLNEMKDDGIRPDRETWSLALRYADTANSRFRILRKCLDAGYLTVASDTTTIIESLVNFEMPKYLLGPYGFNAFREEMEAVFEPGWLTTRIFRYILRAYRTGNAKPQAVSRLLAEVKKKQSPALDRACLLELIKIAKKTGDLQAALEFLETATGQSELDLHEVILEPLFQLAWRERSLNVCRVLWKFACSSGRTTFAMKDVLRHSLKGNSHQAMDEKTKNWQKISAKLILDQDLDVEYLRKALPHLFDDKRVSSILTAQLLWTQGKSRYEQLQLAQFLLERDMNAWRFYYPIPIPDMHQLLIEAFRLDEKLDAAGIWCKTMSFDAIEKVSTGLQQVPLSPRRLPRKHLKTHRETFMFNDAPVDYNTFELSETSESRTKLVQEPMDTPPQAIAQNVLLPPSLAETHGHRTLESLECPGEKDISGNRSLSSTFSHTHFNGHHDTTFRRLDVKPSCELEESEDGARDDHHHRVVPASAHA